MLAIRMQRVGRKSHPEYRVVVQDSRLSPTSEKVVARVGHYNPHTKSASLDKEKVDYYLQNGARPSPRVVKLLLNEKVKLPSWVEKPANDKQRDIKNVEKLRRNKPAEEVVATEETPAETTNPEEAATPAPEEDSVKSESSETSEVATEIQEAEASAKEEVAAE